MGRRGINAPRDSPAHRHRGSSAAGGAQKTAATPSPRVQSSFPCFPYEKTEESVDGLIEPDEHGFLVLQPTSLEKAADLLFEFALPARRTRTTEDPRKTRESLTQARQEVRTFDGELCTIRVLDPAWAVSILLWPKVFLLAGPFRDLS